MNYVSEATLEVVPQFVPVNLGVIAEEFRANVYHPPDASYLRWIE